MSYNEVSEGGSFIRESELVNSRYWVAVRVEDGLDIMNHEFTDDMVGPYRYRNGRELKAHISESIYQNAKGNDRYIQLVIIRSESSVLVPPNTPFKLKDLGKSYDFVVAPALSYRWYEKVENN